LQLNVLSIKLREVQFAVLRLKTNCAINPPRTRYPVAGLPSGTGYPPAGLHDLARPHKCYVPKSLM